VLQEAGNPRTSITELIDLDDTTLTREYGTLEMNFPDGYNLRMGSRRRYAVIFTVGFLALCLLAGVAYNLPPVHDRLAWLIACRTKTLPCLTPGYRRKP
jgi:hypothetical protein